MRAKSVVVAALVAVASTSSAGAACVGSASFALCNDSYGNSYSVQRFGGTTITQGSNARTGSNWSQTDNNFGGSTLTDGVANGRSWDMQRQSLGGGFSTYSGTDLYGDSFSGMCGPFGCN